MTALMPEDSRTQAEEVVVRFKTTRPRGLLLATSLENSPDRLQIYLEEGKARVLIHIGDREKVRSRHTCEFPRPRIISATTFYRWVRCRINYRNVSTR